MLFSFYINSEGEEPMPFLSTLHRQQAFWIISSLSSNLLDSDWLPHSSMIFVQSAVLVARFGVSGQLNFVPTTENIIKEHLKKQIDKQPTNGNRKVYIAARETMWESPLFFLF